MAHSNESTAKLIRRYAKRTGIAAHQIEKVWKSLTSEQRAEQMRVMRRAVEKELPGPALAARGLVSQEIAAVLDPVKW